MPNKNDSSRSPGKPAGEASSPKKPSALLDLKATEVSSGGNKPTAAGTSSPASTTPAAATGAKPAEPAPGPQTSDASANPKPATQPGSKPAEAGSSPSSAGSVKAGAAKAAAETAVPKTAGAQPINPGTAQESKTATAAKPSSGGIGRVLTHVTAGVAGGFLALLAADVLGPRIGIGTQAQIMGELQQRLTAAEQAIRERPAAQPSATAELQQKLAEVEYRLARIDEINRVLGQVSEAQSQLSGETKALSERVGQTSPGEISERIAKLEQMLATLTAAAGSDEPGRIPQLAAITGKLADLEATVPNQLAELRKSLSAEIDTRLAQTAEASEAARSATLRIDRELAAAKADVARLTQRDEGLKSSDDRLEQSLRAVQEEAGSLRSALDGLKAELSAQLKSVARAQDVTAAVAPVEGRIAALEQSVQGVVKSEEDRRTNAERIVLSLELGNLKRALDRGGSYAAELSEVSRIGAGKIDLVALDRYKDQGVPTLAELAREFRPVAHAIIDAASVPAEASALDRLLMGAKSIVRVRRTEHSPNDTSVEAIVARMEESLAEGKLSEVLTQAQQLPLKAAEPAQAWLAKVEARAAVDQALASIEGQLKASLSGKTPVEKRTH